MIKLRTIFGFYLLLLLSSCNAFRQKVNVGPGSEKVIDHTFEIVVMLSVAFALGLWLGWILWNKYKQMVDGLRLENESLSTAVNNMRGELEASKLKLTAVENERSDLTGQVNSLNWENSDLKGKIAALDSDLAQYMERNKSLETELGLSLASSPESAEVPMEIVTSPVDLHVEDLAATDEDLSETSVETAPEIESPIVEFIENEVIEEPGELVADAPVVESPEPLSVETIAATAMVAEELVAPATVEASDEPAPEPTVIFVEGNEPAGEVVVEDVEAQAETPANEETVATPPTIEIEVEETPLAEEETAEPETPTLTYAEMTAPLVAPVAVVDQRDDLKIVEGIGPKIEELLFRNGIYTFTQLAATPVNRIKEILVAAGPSYAMHDPGTWPAQSLLAANGEWDNLRAYQGFLNAGKRPV